MLIMFGDNHTLILALIDTDIAALNEGRTVTYLNPPHDPQLIRDIVVMGGQDKETVINLLKASGIKVTEHAFDLLRKGVRTDRPPKDH